MPDSQWVNVALSGFAQMPDEQSGQPRVTRLFNMRVLNGTALEKTPGFVNVALSLLGSESGNFVALGSYANGTFGLLRRLNAADSVGASVYYLVNVPTPTAQYWIPAKESDAAGSATVVDDEAPTTYCVFDDARYLFCNPGVVSTDELQYVVFAEGLENATGVSVFSHSNMHYAITQFGVAGLEVLYRGKHVTTLGPDEHCHCASSGRYVAFYEAATQIRVWYFSQGQLAPQTLAVLTGARSATLGNHQLAIAHDAVGSRVVVVDGDGKFWIINTNTSVVAATGTLTGLPAIKPGTIGIAAVGNAGHYFVAYLTSTYSWSYVVLAIADNPTPTVVLVTTAIVSPALPLAMSASIQLQASVTAWYNPAYGPHAEGAFISIVQGAGWTGGPSGTAQTTQVYLVNAVGRSPLSYAGIDCLNARGISAPMAPSGNGYNTLPQLRIWCKHTSSRSMRQLVCLSQAEETFVDGSARFYPAAKAHAFVGGNPTIAAPDTYIGVQNPAVYSYNIPAAACQNKRSGWLVAALGMRSADSVFTNVYLIAQVTGENHTVSAALCESLQVVNSPVAAHVSSAVPAVIQNKVSGGALYTPDRLLVYDYGSGVGPGAGSYQYATVLTWRDRENNICRGPVSDIAAFTATTGNDIAVQYAQDIWEPWMRFATLSIYRTTNNGTVFYLLAAINDLPKRTPGIFRDNVLDATLLDNETLYTQGARSGLGGMLEWWGTPPCRCLWAGGTRMIAGGLETPNRVKLSNEYFPGEMVSWPNHEAFSIDVQEAVTAVAVLGDGFLIFSRDAIWLVIGQGPDASGQGAFEAPKKLQAETGARSQRSLVETPEGIMFQGSDGQIYVVQAGSFAVVWKSQGIAKSIAKTAPSDPTYYSYADANPPSNWVTGAAHDPSTREVWFAENYGRMWVYQLDFGQWRAEHNAVDADHGFSRPAIVTLRDSNNVLFKTPVWPVVEGFYSTVLIRNCRQGDAWLYWNTKGEHRQSYVHTSVVDIRRGRVRRAWVREAYPRDAMGLATGNLTSAHVSWWFDGKPGDRSEDILGAVTGGAGNDQYFRDLEFCPSTQKCNQVRMCWHDVPAVDVDTSYMGLQVASIDLEVVQASSGRGPIRRTAGSTRA